ncbi:MAG: hypothetical protein D6705_05025 [Deltaproteobacteria bacterium]|nr:MAG: hypothetical protein D6705_05025 [Deltaproteobacteria bacterium]
MDPRTNENRSSWWSRRGIVVLGGIGVAIVLFGAGRVLGVPMRPYLEYIVILGLLGELVRCRYASRKA